MAYKILIVDDETMLTELLSDHLQDCGYMVSKANSSDEALAKLNTKPNLILLDINMPGMDGLELCKAIQNHIVCPILFLTARITEQDKVNGLRAGGDNYITKPFSLQELTARIEAHAWLQEMEDVKLYQRLCQLGEKELELFTLMVVDGYRQVDIARLWGCTQNAVTKRLNRIKKVLSKGQDN